jgi:hypothetical protein
MGNGVSDHTPQYYLVENYAFWQSGAGSPKQSMKFSGDFPNSDFYSGKVELI